MNVGKIINIIRGENNKRHKLSKKEKDLKRFNTKKENIKVNSQER